MPVLVTDPDLEDRLKRQRQLSGGDRFDEVWEGVYMMAPLADNEHQSLAGRLTGALQAVLGWSSAAKVLPGANISDREQAWEENYRCPDVVVVLPGTKAIDRGTHWFGGPDFAIEILSPYDRSREKFPFYASVGVRELLLVDRYPWKLELHGLDAGQLLLKGTSTLTQPDSLSSAVLPLSFRQLAGKPRPQIEIQHHDGQQRWLA